uniref:BRCT domain-containing protein n=1 Tax=Globisporangium ultimum (strain ATCC 200006 / CBS 805.95 / DAOM BR144) TaxID=431595 RepID=K3X8H7_GLOUD
MAAAAASNGAASSAASGRGAAPAASAASAHDGASALLLRGHRFYVARDIGQARRRELQTLIKNNGGVVEQRFMPGAVELVESDRLKIGTKWVSVDFVYDSVRDQVLQDVHQYMAAAHAHNVAQQRNERIGEDPKRQGKVFFTASDDAKMLQFIVK